MAKNTDNIIIFVTCASFEEAEKISGRLLNKKLVACCNLIKDVTSSYWWKSNIEKSSEIMLVFKSRKKHFKDIIVEIKRLHSYSVPEIIAVPIIDGNQDYLKWIKTSTK